jgi:hypothetical protein
MYPIDRQGPSAKRGPDEGLAISQLDEGIQSGTDFPKTRLLGRAVKGRALAVRAIGRGTLCCG